MTGGVRQLGIPTPCLRHVFDMVVDRLVQQAILQVLEPILEPTFSASSAVYPGQVGSPTRAGGFRPGRKQHQALDALAFGIKTRNVQWVLDADISRFLDTAS